MEDHQFSEEGTSWWQIDWAAPLWQLMAATERLSSLHPLAIVAPKRLDISFRDIGHALRLVFTDMLPGGDSDDARQRAALEVADAWDPKRVGESAYTHRASADGRMENATRTVAPFLSVRTAFDLYLKALKLPRGSLVVCTALTIPDMVTILEEHGLVLLPVDLDPNTLAPEAGALEAEVEARLAERGGDGSIGRVRAIYVAHVFGAQIDMTNIAEAAERLDILLWEDCAQLFTGLQGYLGHPKSDAVFFSFGIIKRATALGGGIACIRDACTLSAMLDAEAGYPTQSTAKYLQRILKCSLILGCTSPLIYGVLVHVLRFSGIDHNKLIVKVSKGFPKKGLLKAIRHRPSTPLLQVLASRVTQYDCSGIEIRLGHCNRILGLLEAALSQDTRVRKDGSPFSTVLRATDVLPGTHAHRHTLWLFPLIANGGSALADSLVDRLIEEGFDVTRAPTSLVPIERSRQLTERKEGFRDAASPGSCSLTPRCSSMMDSLVYLPLNNNIPDSEVDRMTMALAKALSASTSPPMQEDMSLPGTTRSLKGIRRNAIRGIVAFTCRLDVIAVSTILIFLALLFVLAWQTP